MQIFQISTTLLFILSLIVRIKKDFLLHHTATIVTSLALLNFLFYFLNRDRQLPYLAFIGYTTFASMFGILVYELTTGANILLKKIFSISILRFLGKISYGLYMFHWPMHYFLRKDIFIFFDSIFEIPVIYNNLITALSTMTIAILLSLISYHLFEMKFLKLKQKFQ
jgi:peptidoglycan/LPS O-acetylase OafA/YrhL